MKHYPYLIIGGGMTAAAAAEGIREVDPNGLIGMISAEKDPPYNRPPLSKGLWKGKPLDRIWRKTPAEGVDLILDCRVEMLDVKNKRVILQDAQVVTYDRLLLATGGRPRRFPFGDDSIIYFRTLQDYRRLHSLAEQDRRFAVIGGGFTGSEIAAALAMHAKQVTYIIRHDTIYGRNLPPTAGEYLNELFRRNGVKLLTNQELGGIQRSGDGYRLSLRSTGDDESQVLDVDTVIAGIGIAPNVELAQRAGLYVDDGIWVDEYLQTTAPEVFAAGDVASFHNAALGRRRVEHEDNANAMGRAAGRNMAGAVEKYDYLPYFYSDLFDFGYEAVGEMDPDAEQIMEWKRPFEEGTLYYVKHSRLRGVLYWNTFGQVDAGRALIADQRVPSMTEHLVPVH